MNTALIIALIAAAAVIVIALVVWLVVQSKRRAHLRERFGDEYDRVVDVRDNRRAAEAELRERESRREQLDVRDLDPATQRTYADRWRHIQETFVDEPGGAVRSADRLVSEVMRDRGYPVDDFETRADLISVDHPDLVDHYRRSHAVARRHDRNEASTDDLRQAFLHYRALFDELLGVDATRGDGPAR